MGKLLDNITPELKEGLNGLKKLFHLPKKKFPRILG
jgi:hypothetical protein